VRNERGQSMTEFLVILPVMLFLIFGAIQFILIYQTKTTLNYATFEATRAGSLEKASYSAVANGFSRGLAPLFARFSTTNNKNEDLAAKVISARQKVRDELNAGHVKIELLNPTSVHFQRFGNPIPNDHLSFGGEDGIQDANLLKLRITYCMKLIVPMVGGFISGVARGNCTDKENRFPIVSQSIIRMQTSAEKCKEAKCFD